MLDSGQPSNIGYNSIILKWQNEPERRAYQTGAALSLLVMLLGLGLGLVSEPANSPRLLLQFGVSLVVFGFCVGADWLAGQGHFRPTMWQRGAVACAGLVILTSLVAGEYFNLLLAPLLIGIASRMDNQKITIRLGIGAAILIGLELGGFYLLGISRQVSGLSVVALTALAALTLTLTTLMRRYQRQVNQYREAAANKASEMEVAHEIQTSLMPPNQFTSGNWTLAARSLPAMDVGGDFYEYVKHPHLDGMISGIAIGDVAGKGIPAALQMAVVRTLFRVEARRRIFPAETLLSVNLALQAERSFGMVTMLYAFIDIQSNMLHLANAGHNYPLLLNDTLEEVKLPGLPLGIDDGAEYNEEVVKLTPGTSVIFYTDGVVEAMNQAGDLYTFERFKEAVQANRELGPVEMVEKILSEIAVFTQGAPQSDDITVLVLQYHPQPALSDLLSEYKEPVGAAVVDKSSSRPGLEIEIDENGVNWI